jgi:hypothetical protein
MDCDMRRGRSLRAAGRMEGKSRKIPPYSRHAGCLEVPAVNCVPQGRNRENRRGRDRGYPR